MRTLKLYATGAATGNAVAQVVIPVSTRIRLVQWAVRINSITDGAQCNLELSRASASEIAVNGAQQCLSEITVESNFVTSGLAQEGVNVFFPCDFPFAQGQICYVHALIAGTVTYTAAAILHYG